MASLMTKERPILFSAPMVRAILDGRKTQTRRIINPQPYIDEMGNFCWNGGNFGQDRNGPRIQAIASPIPSSKTKRVHCPYGKPGDRLWVRETWQGPLFYGEIPDDWNSDKYKNPEYCHYRASGHSCDFTDADDNYVERWSPSIHMPRWASRLLLEIVNVRVERLQDISEEDAIAEGIDYLGAGLFRDYLQGMDIGIDSAIGSYQSLWESINGPGSWDLNPWVWVVEFKKIER